MKTYKLYPIRVAEIYVKGEVETLRRYLVKNAEHFTDQYGILRAKLYKGNPENVHHVRIEFPICEIDDQALGKLKKLTEEMEAEGLLADFVTPIKPEMVYAGDFPYEDVGTKIWKLHGQQRKAYEAKVIRLEKLRDDE